MVALYVVLEKENACGDGDKMTFEPLKNKIKSYPRWIEKQIEEKNLIKFEKINLDNPPLLKETVYITEMKLKTNCLFYHHDGMCLYTGKDFDCENCEFYALNPAVVKQKIEGLKKEILNDMNDENDIADLSMYKIIENDIRKDILKIINKWFEDVIE